MTEDSILRMEQDADRLVEELAALKREVGTYRAASGELEKARVGLSGFIEATRELAAETHALVAATKTIGGAEILNELAAVRRTAEESRKKMVKLSLAGFTLLVIILILQFILLGGMNR